MGCLIAFVLAVSTSINANATTYPLPKPEDSVIGQVQHVTSRYEDTLLEIGRKYGIGYEEMAAANPGIDPWLPGEGTHIVIPTQYVLPNVPRVGIVVNLPEHRIYYFPKPTKGEQAVVQTYPVSIGRMDWKTPLGTTYIASKQVSPAWYPPESIRKEHAADGDPFQEWFLLVRIIRWEISQCTSGFPAVRTLFMVLIIRKESAWGTRMDVFACTPKISKSFSKRWQSKRLY